jgi:SOS response associated peptidase (SRAP)
MRHVRESNPEQRAMRYGIVESMDMRDSRAHNYPPRWNAAPSEDLLVIRRNHETGTVSLDPLRWGSHSILVQGPKGGRKPINAKCETVHALAGMPAGGGAASCRWTAFSSGGDQRPASEAGGGVFFVAKRAARQNSILCCPSQLSFDRGALWERRQNVMTRLSPRLS